MRPKGNYVLVDAGTPTTVRVEKKPSPTSNDSDGDEYSFQTTLEKSPISCQKSNTASLQRVMWFSHIRTLFFQFSKKEVFMKLPPVFENEEFLSLSLSASDELVLCYLRSSLDALALANRQRAYLLCCSLRNLLDFTSHRGQSLIDVIMLFTPILFPKCKNTTEGFLRACRAMLMMIEQNQAVFRKFFPTRTEDDFLRDLLNSLDGLQLYSIDGDVTTEETSAGVDEEPLHDKLPLKDSQPYYTLTFCD